MKMSPLRAGADERFDAFFEQLTGSWGRPGMGPAVTNRERLISRESWIQAEIVALSAGREEMRKAVLDTLRRRRENIRRLMEVSADKSERMVGALGAHDHAIAEIEAMS